MAHRTCIFPDCEEPRSRYSRFCEQHHGQYHGRKDYRLNLAYGISLETYVRMLEQQGHVCAICGNPEYRKGRGRVILPLSVDHDHACCPAGASCGRCVRGLLCMDCNAAIGLMRDNPERLRLAIGYLTGQFF